MVEQLFRGLLRIDRDLNVVPELAQNMNVSDDGLTYLFMLREDARWSDGEPVTADDFVFACAQLREEGHDHGLPARRHRGRRGARRLDARSSACGRRATTSRTSSPRTGRTRGRGTARSELGADWRSAGVARRQRPVRARRGRRGRARVLDRQPALARRPRATSARCASRSARPRTRSRRGVAGGAPRRPARPATRGVADAPDTVVERAPQLSTTLPRPQRATTSRMDDERVRLAHRPRHRPRAVLAAARPGIDLAAGRGGLIPPVMPGHGADAGAAPTTPSGRGRCSTRRATRAARGLPELRGVRAAVAPGDGARRAARRRRHPRARAGAGEQVVGVTPQAATSGCPRWHADYPDPDGFFLGLLRIEPFYRDDGDRRRSSRRARASRDRDERHAPLPRVRAPLDRPARGDRAAVVRAPARAAAALRARPRPQPDARRATSSRSSSSVR